MVKAKRVLFIVGAYPPTRCGVGDYTSHLASALSLHGLEAHVLTSTLPDEEPAREMGSGVFVHRRVPSWSLRNLHVISSMVREIQPQIVHIQYPASFGRGNRSAVANMLGWVAGAARSGRSSVVTTFHEFSERSWQWRARATVNAVTSDAIICVSSFDQEALRKVIGKAKGVFCIPIASNIPVAPISPEERFGTRRSLGVAPSELLIAYFGFITAFKGFDTTLRAVRLLKDRGMAAKLLVLTRFDVKDRYSARMSELIDGLGIRDLCLISSRYFSEEDVSRYLQSADVAVLPFPEGASERRGSLIAALVHRLPTITTRGPATPPEFIDGQNMVLVPPWSAEGVVRAVEKVVAEPAFCSRLVAGAGELSGMFSWPSIAERTIDVYQNARPD